MQRAVCAPTRGRLCGRAARGFTLIEMLVVLAVIMILISLLLPGLRGAREAGRTAVCLSNQKQICAAVSTYANSSKDVIPREGTDVTDVNGVSVSDPVHRRYRLCWPVALRPFLDDRVSVDQDPNDLFANAPYYTDPARPKDGHNVHYVVNAMPMVSRGAVDTDARTDYWHRRGPEQLSRLQNPGDTLYLTEFTDDADHALWNQMVTFYQSDQEDLTWSQLYDIWDVLHITPGSGQYRISSTRHSGNSSNATYMDGHAATVRPAVLQSLEGWDDRDYGVRDETPTWALP